MEQNEQWQRLDCSPDLGPDERSVLVTESDEILIFRNNGRLMAISNVCPHKMGPLSKGEFKDSAIECPWHGFTFGINSGQCLNNKCSGLKIYLVKEDKEAIYIKEVGK